jgi:hypothetical protein
MGVALGWVALALAGLGAGPHADRDQTQVTYTVRMVEADGLGWREAVFTSLKPVARQGSATIWTAPRETMTKLLENVAKAPATKILQAPRVTAFSGAPATIQCRENRPLVTQVAWNGTTTTGDGATEKLRVGWHTTLIGRKLDQGILAQVVFEDTAISAVHHVSVSVSDKPALPVSLGTAAPTPLLVGTGKAAGLYAYAYAFNNSPFNTSESVTPDKKMDVSTAPKETKADRERCAGSEECCESKDCDSTESGVGKVVIDVPEIDTQEVLGEWLIPRGEILLVSFGVRTTADKDGKAVVKERLAMIEAVETADSARVAGLAGSLPIVSASVPRVTGPAPKVAMPTPTMPSRSIPQGVHADGSPAGLPPLPADETEPAPSESESSEPMPSPQTKKSGQPKPASDSGANKAEFSLPKAAATFLPSFFMPGSTSGFQFLLPMKPLSIKLPFGQKLEVEIFGRVVPESDGR